MPPKDARPGPDEDPAIAAMAAEFAAAFGEMTPEETRQVLGAVLERLGAHTAAELSEPVPSRRHRPRPDVVTFRVRVDLRGAKPPIWRRLDLASDLPLDELHDVVQAAMGWTDSHLHAFTKGDSRHDRFAEHYLTAYDLEEGDEGVAEWEVRLDEVLAKPGDRLLYTYDFGDGWEHTIRLEAVLDRPDDGAPAAVCVDGRRACPPEDCGGLPGYEEILEANARPEVEGTWGREMLDAYFPDGGFDPAAFDKAEVNRYLRGELERPSLEGDDDALLPGDDDAPEPATAGLPEPVADLVRRAVGPGRQALLDLIARARLSAPVLVDAEVATRMVRPFAWLLDRVGADGLPMTEAGYLRPADVVAVASTLGLEDGWIGARNREAQTLPVLRFRQVAQQAGIVRVYRKRLVATKRGRALAADSVALWWHLARGLPPKGAPYERDAGILVLLLAAAGMGDPAPLEPAMRALGWAHVSGANLTPAQVLGDASDTRTVLRRVGAYSAVANEGADPSPTPEGAVFARAALRTWA